MTVLFVQGAGEDVHDRWDDELVKSLEHGLGPGCTVRYPRMPDEAEPRYAPWKTALLDELESLEAGSVLVGHSVGGTILLHVLAEQPPRRTLSAVFLIAAPFIGDGGWPSEDIQARADFSECLPAGVPIFLYHGTDDEIVPYAHVHLYARAIPQALVRTLAGRDHQLNNDLSEVARDIRSLTTETGSPRRSHPQGGAGR